MFNQILILKDNLINNIKQVKHKNPNSKICAMVKANAYGVGDVEVVHILERYVDFWGVACFFEAQKIKNLTKKPILILGAVEKDDVSQKFSYVCSSLEDLKYLISLNKPIKIHLKINTGMNRYGFKKISELKTALKLIKKSSLILEGVLTHFATTDEFVATQMQRFNRLIKIYFKEKSNLILHVDNSIASEKFCHNLDMVRIGFSLYNRSDNGFLPAVEIKSQIVQIQKVKKGDFVGYDYRYVAKENKKIGIVPIGYADGFDMKYLGLKLSIENYMCEVLNICMDCFMIDLTKTKIKKGDVIYVLNKNNSLKLYADHLRTSEYEIMTKFSHLRGKRNIV